MKGIQLLFIAQSLLHISSYRSGSRNRDSLRFRKKQSESEEREIVDLFEGDIIHDEFVDIVYDSTSSHMNYVTYPPSEDEFTPEDKVHKSTFLYSDCPNHHSRHKRATSIGTRRLWDKGVVYYDFEFSVSIKKQLLIKSAMEHWESHTCIRFQPRYRERDFLSFYNGGGCFTAVGKSGGRQGVSINDACMNMGTVVHELGHALGFWHEHSRPDRDESVEIIWENITPGREHNFNKMNNTQIDSRDIIYDYNSIMHYGPHSFARSGILPTIAAKNGSSFFEPISMGQRSRLSTLDVQQANRMYCCPIGACSKLPCRRGRCQQILTNPFYQCTCFEGWYGSDCSVHNNKCASFPCVNGECRADLRLFAGFECICKSGYQGMLCEQEVDECLYNKCKNGQCLIGVGIHSCQCFPGFTGMHCDIDMDDCATQPCGKHGVCIDHVDDFECDCFFGYMGKECNIKANFMCDLQEGLCRPWRHSSEGNFNWTLWAGPTPSQGTGPETDHTIGTSNGYYLYTEGSNSQSEGDKAIIEAGPLSKSDGSCLLSFAYHMKGDTMGELVVNIKLSNQTVREIWQTRGHQSDNWQMTAITIGVNVMYTLQIVGGKGSFWKSDAAIDDIMLSGHCGEIFETCSDIKCGVEGRCHTDHNGFSRCLCNAGYRGQTCDEYYNECVNEPCNNGTCRNASSGYECACFSGFIGDRCEYKSPNVCTLDLCKNGTCIPQNNIYMCECDVGFTGRHCKASSCTPESCLNNGTCVQLPASFQCVCTKNFSGVKCETSHTNIPSISMINETDHSSELIDQCKTFSMGRNCDPKIYKICKTMCCEDDCIGKCQDKSLVVSASDHNLVDPNTLILIVLVWCY